MKGLKKALDDYLKKDYSSFHMPGHKGVGEISFRYDVTESEGFESLYENKGAIKASERLISQLYGHSVIYSAGGSTLAIQTMLGMSLSPGEKLLINRGVHTAAVNAMALLGVEPEWIYPNRNEATGLALPITADQLRDSLTANPSVKVVMVTSPDYYGQLADIAALSEVCRGLGARLLVDCAHGSHLTFTTPSLHPVDLGADICCSSLHKTLPAMTGAAALHLRNSEDITKAKRWMSIFGSTSPSFAILVSADTAVERLSKTGKAEQQEVINRVEYTKGIARDKGFIIPENTDPARITLGFWGIGYDEREFLALLHLAKLQPEYTDASYAVLIPSINTSLKDWNRLEGAVKSVEPRMALPVKGYTRHQPEKAMSLREAVFSESEVLPLAKAEGRTLGTMVCPCPPGIPLVIPGERLDKKMMNILIEYGILEINVI